MFHQQFVQLADGWFCLGVSNVRFRVGDDFVQADVGDEQFQIAICFQPSGQQMQSALWGRFISTCCGRLW